MPEVAGHFSKRVTNYRALLRKITSEDKASYGSSPPYTNKTFLQNASNFWTHPFYICEQDSFPKCIYRASQDARRINCNARGMLCVAAYCSVLQWVAVYCCELQCVAASCSVLHCHAMHHKMHDESIVTHEECGVLQRIAACCSVLQLVAAYCSVLQWVDESIITHEECIINQLPSHNVYHLFILQKNNHFFPPLFFS